MKRILGLDLGTSSVGWAVVDQAENDKEKSQIIKMGVRIVPLDTQEKTDFEKGESITTTAERTRRHGMRINLQRYKQRRKHLLNLLKREGFITDKTLLYEDGNHSTFETYRLRAKAAIEEISLEQLARVLLMINKKRGYKSNRKADKKEDGQLIDGMSVARKLYDEHLTPGQLVHNTLQSGGRYIPSFYQSDLKSEFNAIWSYQAQFYPEILDDELKNKISGRKKNDTARIIYAVKHVSTAENKDRKTRLQVAYRWRSEAVNHQLPIEQVAAVLCDINGNISSSSGYLGRISDHSKELYFQKLTVGQYLMQQLGKDPHFSLKNRVFYRQDYLNEFETIWETQRQFHLELTDGLKEEVRDTIIFYQRKLKSKKGLISFCELEGKEITVTVNGQSKKVMTGPRVCPKSSPLFQEFKIWQELNNLVIEKKREKATTGDDPFELTNEHRQLLHDELSVNHELSKTDVLKLLGLNPKHYSINYKSLQGNTTQEQLITAYKQILEWSGHDVDGFDKLDYATKMQFITQVFKALGVKTDFLEFNPEQLDNYLEQPAYKLWHLLYSYETDNSETGDAKLKEHLKELTGLSDEYVTVLASVQFEQDYGSLSAKAIKRIMPHLLTGKNYSDACEAVGYRHSAQSLNREELDTRPLESALADLPKNSLHNPVVEKILNQMIHVVNAAMQEYGVERDGVKRFDEIHVEMARSLKQSKKQREETSDFIEKRTKENEGIIKVLRDEFGIAHPSRNDIIRYRLYMELKDNGFKTLYSDTYIPKEELFSNKFEIEHIIPQAKLFDDSLSNKTLETHEANIEKSNRTALDYILDKYGEIGAEQYRQRVAFLYDGKHGSNKKYKNLLLTETEIPVDFLNRDLANTQYIARKAQEILMQVTRTVVPTIGAITARLREDWQLVDVMKELNKPKYKELGRVVEYKTRDGRKEYYIKDWTKRNDHRHHAMDALTVAFTRWEHVQYLNNMNANQDEDGLHPNAWALRSKLMNDRKFIPPMPLDQFRASALEHMRGILVSIKAKNKVATRHVNRISGSDVRQVVMTPRTQLHKETYYGSRQRYVTTIKKVDGKFDAATIAQVARKDYREALMSRLDECGGNAKKAFTGKNALPKVPLYTDAMHTTKVPENVKLVWLETYYIMRIPVNPSIKIDKVIDKKVQAILQRRLEEFDNDANKAFSNLDENPIWLNKEKGIAIKRVTIQARLTEPIPLHDKLNRDGSVMKDNDGNTMPVDYVSTSNNHHIAIYEDSDGDWHEKITSYFEAIARLNNGMPIVDKHFNEREGWRFMFTLKQNEYFVFPDEKDGFQPSEIDLMDEQNYPNIAKHLFRVQSLSQKDYRFRQQFESSVTAGDALPQGFAYFRIRKENGLKGIVKVRINHIGQIVHVGEYN